MKPLSVFVPLVFFVTISPMFSREDGVRNYMQLQLPGVIGPESIAFDCHRKGPYVGVSDGRILRWQGARLGWRPFAYTSPSRQVKSILYTSTQM